MTATPVWARVVVTADTASVDPGHIHRTRRDAWAAVFADMVAWGWIDSAPDTPARRRTAIGLARRRGSIDVQPFVLFPAGGRSWAS